MSATSVLLIESDPAYRAALARSLFRSGLQPIEIPTAMQALDVLDRTPEVGRAVVNVRMPPNTLNGLAFGRMMNHRNKAARIVVMLNHAGDNDLLDELDEQILCGTVVKATDIAAVATDIVRLLG